MMMPHRFAPAAAALVLAGALFVAPAHSQAIDPAHLASARAMMTASGANSGLDQIIPNFLEEARRVVIQTRPDLDKVLTEATVAIAPDFKKQQEELLNAVAEQYARRFTKSELDQIAAFYSSPTGKKMVSVLPGLGVETRDYIVTFTQTLSTDIFTKLRAEMKKRGYDL
jgi:uncharacterized protein